MLACLLNRKMRGRSIYRTLLVLPWAIPQIIAVLAWRNEFHYEYGFINIMIRNLGLQPVSWLTQPTPNFIAMCITNIWLGIPFMMIIFLGGLQSISDEYYEAAEMDGANNWWKFKSITMPLLAPVMTPAIILGSVWTFNNFNIPFFINQNELESSDILVTALFRTGFQYNRYGFLRSFCVCHIHHSVGIHGFLFETHRYSERKCVMHSNKQTTTRPSDVTTKKKSIFKGIGREDSPLSGSGSMWH